MLLDVFAEETDIGEIQLEGDFFHGEVGLQQVVSDMADDALRNPVHGCPAALFLADRAEVFGGNQQLLGVCLHLPFGVGRAAEQVHEALEQTVFL